MASTTSPAPRASTLFVLVSALAWLAAACGPDGGNETVPVVDAGTDTAVADTGDDTAVPETGTDTAMAGDADAEVDVDAGPPDWTRPTIPSSCSKASPAAASKRSEIEISEWHIGTPGGNGRQQLVDDLRDDSFRPPTESKYGTSWKTKSANKDGSIPHSFVSGSRTLVYAAAEIKVDELTVVAAESDGFYRLYANGKTYPGGVYGKGNKMVPVELPPGTNVVTVLFANNQSPKLQLFETPDLMAFNTEDTTTPELRVGHATEQPLGVHVLNLAARSLKDVEARVLENQYFKPTSVEYRYLGPNAVTQLAFELEPKSKWSKAGEKIPVELAVASCGSKKAYEKTVELKTVGEKKAFKRTFRSPVDWSAQYYGVLPPKNFDAMKKYGLALTLHGASVDAKGHVTAYTKKDWLYHVAPTNRRPFGFDWEEWGKFNGMNALDHAMKQFDIKPGRVYVTGHSMGGHGTWHFGTMHPDRFATVGPSAGWQSFYTYGGSSQKPSGSIRRARAHSETLRYLENLADRGAYIVHGGADFNVPPSHGRKMRDELKKYTSDVKYHEEPNAKHWWDRQMTPGTDCVDWDPLFTFFDNHTLDPSELDFKFKSPGPWYSDEHSYVRVRSSKSPMKDFVLESTKKSSTKVELLTTNVRSMDIDGKALQDKGIQEIVVDGMTKMVPSSTLEIGPRGGKKPGQNGTFNQVMRDPFCYVYPDDGSGTWLGYSAYLISTWAFRGNGHACALPVSEVDEKLRKRRNLIYLGVDFEKIPDHANRPFGWTDSEISIGPNTYNQGVEQVVFPTKHGLSAAITAVKGSESLVWSLQPFSSREGKPDYLLFDDNGGLALGFFDNEWKFDSSLGQAR